jgi:hypothetical protein
VSRRAGRAALPPSQLAQLGDPELVQDTGTDPHTIHSALCFLGSPRYPRFGSGRCSIKTRVRECADLDILPARGSAFPGIYHVCCTFIMLAPAWILLRFTRHIYMTVFCPLVSLRRGATSNLSYTSWYTTVHFLLTYCDVVSIRMRWSLNMNKIPSMSPGGIWRN